MTDSNAPNSPQTITVTLKVKSASAPLVATNFSGMAKSESSILWTWTDNSDDETGFRMHNDSNNTNASLPADTNFWLETGLTADTKYSRHINAYNSYGNVDSNTSSVRTFAPPPSNLSANAKTIESCVVLSWSANSGTRFALERAVDSNGVAGSWQAIKSWNDQFTSETFIDTGVSPAAKYWYRVKSYNSDGVINNTPSNEVSVASSDSKPVAAAKAAVYNNFVEPDKNQPLYIKCDLPAKENVTVIIYDLAGQEIKKIVDNERKPAGMNILEWAGKNMDNEIVASGSYIVYIKAGDFVEKKNIGDQIMRGIADVKQKAERSRPFPTITRTSRK